MFNALPQPRSTGLIPENETNRLAALHRYQVLDTPPEAAFDRITKLAARLFETPIALISLVDESRAWFKSSIGFDACEVPRDQRHCFAGLIDAPLMIPDAQLDDPGIRFYAGAPLISPDGFNLGTLCLLDRHPHLPLSLEQEATLIDLAAMVIDALELRSTPDQKQIEHQRERFLAVSSDLQMITGANGDFQWVSPTFESILGWTPEEMIAHPWTEFIHPEDEPVSLSETATLCSNHQPFKFETRYRHKNGSYRWFLWNAQFCLEEQAIYAAAVDITDRKQAEAALCKSEEHFRTLADYMSQFAWMADADGWIFWYNRRWFEYTGTTLEEMQGWGWQKVHHPDHLDRVVQHFRQCCETGEAWEDTFLLRDKDGNYRWFLSRAIPIQDQQGKILRWFGTNTDITDLQQAEATIQASNERLKLLSTIANELLLNEDPKALLARLFDRISTHLGLEVYFNYLFDQDQERLHLYTYGGISDEIVQAANVLELGQGVCGYAVQHRQPVIVENAFGSDDSLALPLQSIGIRAYASHPLMVGDRVLGTLGLGTRQRDRFTRDELDLMQAVAAQVAAALERSQLVAELEARAEALAQTNRIKDEFLAVLSHELRSPLNPILGWTRLLQTGKLDSTRQSEALRTIERNAQLQTQLIEDLLDISRIMQGKLALTAAPVRLTSVISAAIETVRLAAEAKNIQVLLDLSPTVAPVSGDATRLQQVVWNLLANAVKFTPPGGLVTIELRQIDQFAQIRVSDTGKGIAPQFLPYVFEYFRQEDYTTTRKFGGLGLGLAIVRQIVEMHGGTVEAASLGEHQGATFTVQIPVIQQRVLTIAEPPHSEIEQTETPLSNLHILVVDDDTDTRNFQAFLLEQNGAKVIAVASGLEALQVLDQVTPDVLVSDVGIKSRLMS
jgi:PAS domain S-box-containing protein